MIIYPDNSPMLYVYMIFLETMQIFDLFSIINPDKQQTNSMQGDIICFARML